MVIKQKSWDRVKDRVFIVPSKGNTYIIYAPLGNFAARVDSGVAKLVKAYIVSKGTYPVPSNIGLELGNLKWVKDSAEAISKTRMRRRFQPSMVTLFPTNRCNLRCSYCYADAGRDSRILKMTMPIAKAAIRFAVSNAKKRGERRMRLGFHGGGEPLLERDFAEACIRFARRLCDSENLSLRLVAATNGCLSESTMEWIADTFDSLSLSCDGPRFIQDSQRPFPNGIGSWEVLNSNVKILQKGKVQFGVRVTITDQSVHYASEIVRFLVEQWNVYDIHLEPLYQKGRGKEGPFHPPSPKEFVDAFRDAFLTCKQLDARLQYSGTRLGEIHSSFCEVDGQSFSVTPDGYATACFEVTDSSKEGSDLFLYGKYSPEKDQFVFDRKKLKALRYLNLETKEFCRNCFCRWNCAGDCPAKCPKICEDGIQSHIMEPGARCEINRAITHFLLEEILKANVSQSRHIS